MRRLLISRGSKFIHILYFLFRCFVSPGNFSVRTSFPLLLHAYDWSTDLTCKKGVLLLTFLTFYLQIFVNLASIRCWSFSTGIGTDCELFLNHTLNVLKKKEKKTWNFFPPPLRNWVPPCHQSIVTFKSLGNGWC